MSVAFSPGEALVVSLSRPKHRKGPSFPFGKSLRPGSENLVLQKYASHCSYSSQPFCAASSLVQIHCVPCPSHPYCLLGGKHLPPAQGILTFVLVVHVNGPRDFGGGDPQTWVVLAVLNTAS